MYKLQVSKTAYFSNRVSGNWASLGTIIPTCACGPAKITVLPEAQQNQKRDRSYDFASIRSVYAPTSRVYGFSAIHTRVLLASIL